MSFKKNLTVAGLAALMAVPAFGAIHNNVHAAYNSSTGVMLTNSELKKTNPQYIYRPGHSVGEGASGPVFGQPGQEDDSIGHYNGHSFHFPDNGGPIVTQLDGQSNPSLSEVNAALYGNSTNSVLMELVLTALINIRLIRRIFHRLAKSIPKPTGSRLPLF